MNKAKKLSVVYNGACVGTLALYRNYCSAFEYSDEWIANGFSISPFSLPLEKKVFIPNVDPFEGLFGVFSDSLPDGWGRLLVDRLLKKKGIEPHAVTSLDRLAIVGDTGMGALEYVPSQVITDKEDKLSLDDIARECKKILGAKSSDKLDTLVTLGGSPGGARPKTLMSIDDNEWIIKFFAREDRDDMGRQEYEYALCAGKCGIEVSEVRLFDSNICDGYFGTKRFDRVIINDSIRKRHMITASALLETSHRVPNLDYDLLMKLTLKMTNDMSECEKLYRRMCFNVFAHNRDDHSKNFTYMYIDEESRWVLSPAYDLTYSNSIGGEHATTINGEGMNPDIEDILAIADNIGINRKKAKDIALSIYECVQEELKEWID